MVMASEDRTKFSLLSENTYQMCNGYHYQFCNPQSVVLDQKLPITKYLSFGIWIVKTEEPLTFTLNCQSFKPRDNVIKLKHHLALLC